MVRLVAAMISPYMPTLTSRIMAQLNLQDDDAQLTDELIQAAATPQVIVCLWVGGPVGHVCVCTCLQCACTCGHVSSSTAQPAGRCTAD